MVAAEVMMVASASPGSVGCAVDTEAKKSQHTLVQSLSCGDTKCLHGPQAQAGLVSHFLGAGICDRHQYGIPVVCWVSC